MDQFVPPIGFCSTKAISDEFASQVLYLFAIRLTEIEFMNICLHHLFFLQALIVGTHEAEIIRLAPFLVPFETRLEIFQVCYY
jgi:hypothetical protein